MLVSISKSNIHFPVRVSSVIRIEMNWICIEMVFRHAALINNIDYFIIIVTHMRLNDMCFIFPNIQVPLQKFQLPLGLQFHISLCGERDIGKSTNLRIQIKQIQFDYTHASQKFSWDFYNVPTSYWSISVNVSAIVLLPVCSLCYIVSYHPARYNHRWPMLIYR